jgi:hypothetical protein
VVAASVVLAEGVPEVVVHREAGDSMNPLEQLVSKLELAFSGKLVSVLLYGSAAGEGQADRFSDLNVLCVLKEITPRELASGEPILRWWREQGNPAPLLMSEEEVATSADSFPIEFRDMQHRRRVLFGPDPIAGLVVHDTQYRTQVEHELRTSLLRLRQQGAAVLSQDEALLALCVDSVTTFCVLARHALLLNGGHPPDDRRSLVRQLAGTIGADFSSFESLLDIRESKKGKVNPLDLFGAYLAAIGALVVFVDRGKHA